MTLPRIKSVRGRPAVELIDTNADSPFPAGGSGSGLVLLGAEWGDGKTSASVIDGERGQIARIPWALSLERWEVLAYAEPVGTDPPAPLAIDCAIEVETADFFTNTWAPITGTEQPTLASEATHESIILAGWDLDHLADTMWRFTLVSHTGAPAKIVLGIRAFT